MPRTAFHHKLCMYIGTAVVAIVLTMQCRRNGCACVLDISLTVSPRPCIKILEERCGLQRKRNSEMEAFFNMLDKKNQQLIDEVEKKEQVYL